MLVPGEMERLRTMLTSAYAQFADQVEPGIAPMPTDERTKSESVEGDQVVQTGKQAIGKTHLVAIGLIIAAIFFWLLFARPRLLGQGQPAESQSVGQPSAENSAPR